jgi:hypothetical protein
LEVDRANVLHRFLRAVTEPAPVANHNGKFMPLTAGYDLPEGYRLECDGISFWVLRGVEYISYTKYPTAAQAERAAWKHAYEKQAELTRDIRQIALRTL